MEKIKAMVIDDEPLAIKVIQSHIEKITTLDLVFSTTKVLEALVYINTHPVDLIFLDVQMPDLTGIQFMRVLNRRAKVILTTAYQQYAFDSYDYDVVDYCLKPISFERLLRATEKAFNHVNAAKYLMNSKSAAEEPQPEQSTIDCLFLKTEYKLQKVFFQDILFMEGGKDYVTVFTNNGKILSLATLSRLQQNLPYPQFMRVHKSFIVAMNKIDSIERQRIYIGREIIPVSDSYKSEFVKHIKGV